MNSTVMAARPSMPNNKIKRSTGESIGTFFIYLIVFLFAVMCILPFILVIIVSFSSEKSITLNGYSFWPSRMVCGGVQDALSAVLRSAAGVFRHRHFHGFRHDRRLVHHVRRRLHAREPFRRYRDGLSLYFYVTMVFSAGLVPWYMM